MPNPIVVLLALAVLGTACTSSAPGRTPSDSTRHRVVFELTSGDAADWQSLIGNVENLQTALGAVTIEVVVHGKALGMLLPSENGAVRERLRRVASDRVVFAACENTMRRRNVGKAELEPFVVTVDAGVAQVVRRQEAGWAYVCFDG